MPSDKPWFIFEAGCYKYLKKSTYITNNKAEEENNPSKPKRTIEKYIPYVLSYRKIPGFYGNIAKKCKNVFTIE